MTTQPDVLLSFIPLLLLGLIYVIPVYMLAKAKGRSTVLWVILALIPIVNLVSLIYIVGAPSLIIERKLDELLQRGRT